ncbi:similar to Saccharomyces cerevisiae YMR102C Protein of unknown function [Maudiozyma barnettii]|uniref:WD repeat-containing protein 44 n=1 Tax=Maudiozyma barnettii TaxID=61262 RepID=A0A8H2ZMI8_9SACH|nr:uncharacterized protein KABA2_13S03784 [Kazachstania barnettii]CAB4257137.1 similar to Saccharomyces cerevisiae YMR102C Protein of unknown function [Kazachstania barnettii]CAD1779507.1 similar to Saccharomyces cerevisiae YMR102C Protein of unknown function [Kazachstania barnettii]
MSKDQPSSPVSKVTGMPSILFNGNKLKRGGSKNSKKEKDHDISSTSVTQSTQDISRDSIDLHEEDNGIEFSADIEPLKFKMKRTPEPDKKLKDSPREYLDSLEQIRQQIENVTNNGSDSNIITTNISNGIPWSFGDIDKEQFEEYLEKPNYIRCLPRKIDFNVFNRLFLAQELKDTSDEPELTYDPTVNNNALKKTRSRGKGSISSNVSNSDSLKRSIWKTQFSLDGKYMAVGSKDGTVKILKVISSPVERWEMDNMDESMRISRAKKMLRMKQIAASSTFNTLNSGKVGKHIADLENNTMESNSNNNDSTNLYAPVFHQTPYKIFKEHVFDVLDLDWSKNNFLLTASMDKTVKLWHLERKESLRTFHHADFVTGAKFHPTDDRFFVTGCLDHKCRLWSIIDNEVSYEYDCHDLITSIEISKFDGKYTIIGTFNGFIHILLTKGLKSVLSFHVSDKEIKWKDTEFLSISKHTSGPRITGIQIISAINEPLRLLITSNDSRIRIFDIEKRKLVEFLKGFQSGSSQHQAFYLDKNGESTVLCSSDDHWLYGWKLRTNDANDMDKERSQSMSTIDTSHDSHLDISPVSSMGSMDVGDDLLENGDDDGDDKVESSLSSQNKKRVRRRSKIFDSLRNLAQSHHRRHHTVVKNARYSCFHAHHAPVTTSLIAPIETSKVLSLSNDFICELTLNTIRDNKLAASGQSIMSSQGTTAEVVKAIGTILITTDNQGTIRVFRTDISTKIRNKVLNDLKQYDEEVHGKSDKQEGPKSMNCFSNVNRSESSTTMKRQSNSKTKLTGVSGSDETTPRSSSDLVPTGEYDLLQAPNGQIINIAQPTTSPNTVYKSSRNNISATSIGRLMGNSSSRRHAKSTSSSNSNNNGKESAPGRNIVANLSALSLRCNVCNSTNFTQYSSNTGLQRENNYSCVDCGTTLNNFR